MALGIEINDCTCIKGFPFSSRTRKFHFQLFERRSGTIKKEADVPLLEHAAVKALVVEFQLNENVSIFPVTALATA